MKSALTLRLLRLALFCTAAMLTFSTGTSAFAARNASYNKSRSLRLPAVVVQADPLVLPSVEATPVIALPNGTVIAPALLSADASFALPDGTMVSLPSRANSDGTVMLPDGSVAKLNADGTLTLADGSLLAAPQHTVRTAPRATDRI